MASDSGPRDIVVLGSRSTTVIPGTVSGVVGGDGGGTSSGAGAGYFFSRVSSSGLIAYFTISKAIHVAAVTAKNASGAFAINGKALTRSSALIIGRWKSCVLEFKSKNTVLRLMFLLISVFSGVYRSGKE